MPILLDSGSAGTFISKNLSAQLHYAPQPFVAMKFVVAGGQSLESDHFIPNLPWHNKNHTFMFDTRILSLQCYDMIIGADWIEAYSPMWFHWKNKIVKFNHLDRRITLQLGLGTSLQSSY